MARRLKQLTCTMSINEGIADDPYVSYVVEMDAEDGQTAVIQRSGTMLWSKLSQIKEGLQDLVNQIVGSTGADAFTFQVIEVRKRDAREKIRTEKLV